MKKTKYPAALILAPLLLLLGACSAEKEEGTTESAAPAKEETTISLGFIPGPYADMFKASIQPVLEEKGITVKVEELSDFTIPNQSTMSDELQGSIFQNEAFMELFNTEKGGDLVSLLHIPSAPLGIYAGRGKAKDVEDIEDGSVIGITSEASNMARSLKFLEGQGLVKLGEPADGKFVTPSDITSNPKNLKFEPLDAPQIPRSLPDLDYGVALGNHIYASGTIKLSDALALEEVPEKSQIIVAVREKNKDADWAKELVNAYKSDDFRKYIENDDNLSQFTKPAWW